MLILYQQLKQCQFVIINLINITKMIIKLTYKSETHLYNKTISYGCLQEFVLKVFKELPKSYSLVYQSNNYEMTYIQTDEDLIGLKYCCSANNDFMIKISIISNKQYQQEDYQKMAKNIISVNIVELGQRAINKLEQELIDEEVSNYLSSTFNTVTQKIMNHQEQKIINIEVQQFLSKLMSKTARKQAENQFCILKPKPIKKRVVHFSPEKPIEQKIAKKSLDSLINERILEIVPKIVDNVCIQFQKRLRNKCVNCIKKQEQLQNAINMQIQKRINYFKSSNPENCEF